MSVGLVHHGSGRHWSGLRVVRLQPPSSSSVGFRRRTATGTWSVRAVSRQCERPTAAPTMSFYELLGIPEGGSIVEIKKAYKQMARKYHPDVSPPGLAEEHTRTFIRVQEAYETLSDPTRRALYDRDLAAGLHLAFSARRRLDEDLEERSGWTSRWQAQVAELKRRSADKNSEANLSWGARMRRRQRDPSAAE